MSTGAHSLAVSRLIQHHSPPACHLKYRLTYSCIPLRVPRWLEFRSVYLVLHPWRRYACIAAVPFPSESAVLAYPSRRIIVRTVLAGARLIRHYRPPKILKFYEPSPEEVTTGASFPQ